MVKPESQDFLPIKKNFEKKFEQICYQNNNKVKILDKNPVDIQNINMRPRWSAHEFSLWNLITVFDENFVTGKKPIYFLKHACKK